MSVPLAPALLAPLLASSIPHRLKDRDTQVSTWCNTCVPRHMIVTPLRPLSRSGSYFDVAQGCSIVGAHFGLVGRLLP